MSSRLLVESPMDLAQAALWVTPDELAEALAFGSARRRAEFLTWRAMVRRELGREVTIAYNTVGRPMVDCGCYLSVAHCAGRVAVLISDAPCAVDIEPQGRNFAAVSARCMSASERALSSDEHFAGIVWCAKEALYKFSGLKELDFLTDLHILHADLAAGCLTGCIKNGEPIGLSVLRQSGYLIVTIV